MSDGSVVSSKRQVYNQTITEAIKGMNLMDKHQDTQILKIPTDSVHYNLNEQIVDTTFKN